MSVNEIEQTMDDYADEYDDLALETGYAGPEFLVQCLLTAMHQLHWCTDQYGSYLKFCDVGAGTGLLSLEMHKTLSSQLRQISALDISAKMLEKVKNKIPHAITKKCDLQTGDWPVEEGNHDIIGACSVLPYICRKQHFFDQAARALRPDGLFIFNYEVCDHLARQSQQYRQMAHKDVVQLAVQAGFEVVNLSEKQSHKPRGGNRPVTSVFAVYQKTLKL